MGRPKGGYYRNTSYKQRPTEAGSMSLLFTPVCPLPSTEEMLNKVCGRKEEKEKGKIMEETEAGYDIVHSRRLAKRPKGRA